MARTFSSDEVVAAAQGVRGRSIALLRSAGEEGAATPVPTCPDWTAEELACHMYGVCDDLLAGRLDGIGSDEWTRAQVERHGRKPFDELLDEWAASAPVFDAIVPKFPEPANYQFVWDQAIHEHDLRLALGSPGARDDLSVVIGVEFMLRTVRVADPELVEEIDGLDLAEFELLRALTGRRSAVQLDAMGIAADRIAAIIEPFPISIVDADLVDEVA